MASIDDAASADAGRPRPALPVARRAGHRRYGDRAGGRDGADRARPRRGRQRGGELRRQQFLAVEQPPGASWPGSTGSPPGWTPASEVPGARQHPVQVTQTDRLLILRDLDTGQVSSLDLATLQITATTRTTAGPRGQRGAARGRRVRRRRGAGRGPPARPAFAGAGRRAGALPAGHHRRRLRRQGPAVDRGARRGHRLGDHRRRAAVRRRRRRAPPVAGPARSRCETVRRRRAQPRAGPLHAGRRGGGAGPDHRRAVHGAGRQDRRTAADAGRRRARCRRGPAARRCR